MNGFENIRDVVTLYNTQSVDSVKQYLLKFDQWDLLNVDSVNGYYRWIYTPVGVKSVDSKEAYDFRISRVNHTQVYTLIFPDEIFLINYVEQLSNDSSLYLKSTRIVEGTQHYRYHFGKIAIELGERIGGGYYIVVSFLDEYNKL